MLVYELYFTVYVYIHMCVCSLYLICMCAFHCTACAKSFDDVALNEKKKKIVFLWGNKRTICVTLFVVEWSYFLLILCIILVCFVMLLEVKDVLHSLNNFFLCVWFCLLVW